jgi:hypothetical protein
MSSRSSVRGTCAVLMTVFVQLPTGLLAATQPPSRTVLIDFSEDHRLEWSDSPENLLPTLLGTLGISRHYADEKQCAADDFDTPVTAGASEIPVHFISGSGEQRLVLIETRNCNQPLWNRNTHLFLLVDGTLSGHVEGCVDVVKLVPSPNAPDLQQGIAECGGMGQGVSVARAAIVGAPNGTLAMIADLDVVRWDNCGQLEDGKERVSVVFQDAGGQRSVKNYERSCASQAAGKRDFKFFSDGQLQEWRGER